MSSGAVPAYISPIPVGVDLSAALAGSEMLRLPLYPQGLQVAGVLEARAESGEHLYPEAAVEMPRRSQKTTAIWAVLLGRCRTIPGYRVCVTAQDGTRAQEIIREFMEVLQANGFEDEGLGTLCWSNGRERIKFENRARIWVVAPRPASFRSQAADVLLFDEAGELDPEKGPALLAAALPLMDTREAPQVIIAGTPGTSRSGLLWESLERGRAGTPGVGVVDYSVADGEALVSWDEDGNKVLHEDVLWQVHPGLSSTMTTIERMRERFARMQPSEFCREYGCQWAADAQTGALDLEAWAAGKVDPVVRPDHLGIGFDVAADGSSSSICYAWRVDGVAHVELVAHRPGVSWVARAAHAAGEKHRRVPVAFDSIGANLDPSTALSQMKPTPKLEPLNMKAIMAAAQRFAADLHEGRVRHFGQPDLDAAVAATVWREIRHSGRAFGARPGPTAVNPVVAASVALWSYDKARERVPVSIVAGPAKPQARARR